MSDFKESNVSTLLSNSPSQTEKQSTTSTQIKPFTIMLNIVKPVLKLELPVIDDRPRHVDFDILPPWERQDVGGGVIPLVLPASIPQHKTNDNDILLCCFTRKEHKRLCCLATNHQNTLNASRAKSKHGTSKVHLPDIVMDRVFKEVRTGDIKKLGTLLQGVASAVI